MFKEFKDGDLFNNRIQAHPQVELFANSGSISRNRFKGIGSASLASVSGSFPFVTKDGTLNSLKAVSSDAYASFAYGDIISGSYPDSAVLFSKYYAANSDRPRIDALKNTFDFYTYRYSPRFANSSSYGDKSTQVARLISLPSLFYGSEIEKGTISCKFYVSGTLIAELGDPNKNGDLIQIGPSGSLGSGSVAGHALYKEGFLMLTGSWSLHSSYTDNFVPLSTGSVSPAWVHFFTTGSNGIDLVPSSSFDLSFKGTQYIPTVTMLCHADKGEFNHSNNPTYIEYGQDNVAFSSSAAFRERDNIAIKNVTNVSYTEEEPKFEKITYISRVAVFDEEKNLIGIAKLATPVRKKEIDSYTFKLKLDI